MKGNKQNEIHNEEKRFIQYLFIHLYNGTMIILVPIIVTTGVVTMTFKLLPVCHQIFHKLKEKKCFYMFATF